MAQLNNVIHLENRLAGAVDTQDGSSVRLLVQEAERRLIVLRPRLKSHCMALLERLLRFALATDEIEGEERREIGRLSLALAELAAAAEMETIGEIARGVSALTAKGGSAGNWDSAAVRLHLQALHVANKGTISTPDEDDLILDRLQRLRDVLGVDDD